MTFQELFQKVLESDIDLDAEVVISPDLPFPDDDPVVGVECSSEHNIITLFY